MVLPHSTQTVAMSRLATAGAMNISPGTTAPSSTAAARAAAQQFIDEAGDGMFVSSSVDVDRTATTVTVTVRGRSLNLVPGMPTPEIRQVISGPIEQPAG